MGGRLRQGWLKRQRKRLEEQDRQLSREDIRLNLAEVELIERHREIVRLAERMGVAIPVDSTPSPSFGEPAGPDPDLSQAEEPSEELSPLGELERYRRRIEARRAALPRRERALREQQARLDRIEAELHRHWQRVQR